MNEEQGFYYNKVKEKLRDMVDNQGVVHMNIWWGDEAYNLTLEERCKWWLEFMAGLEDGSLITETFNADDECVPEWYKGAAQTNVYDYLEMLDTMYEAYYNPHMDA